MMIHLVPLVILRVMNYRIARRTAFGCAAPRTATIIAQEGAHRRVIPTSLVRGAQRLVSIHLSITLLQMSL